MASNYRKLGELITQRREKNPGGNLPIRGVSQDGFIPPKQQDADTSIYNVFYRGDFVYNPARMELGSIAFNDELDEAICSSLYEVFYVHRTDLVLPEYLALFVARDEFARYCEFLGSGSAREYCRFANISEIRISLPGLDEQRRVVQVHKAIQRRIATLKLLNDKLAAFVDFLYSTLRADNCPDDTWTDGTVGEVIQLQRGHDLPRQNMNGGRYPVVGSTDIIGNHDAFTTRAPVIVLGRSGNIGNPRMYRYDCWVHNTALYVKQFIDADPIWAFYMLKHLNYESFVGGSAVPTLNRNNVHAHPLKIPPKSLQLQFSKHAAPILAHIDSIRLEMETLMALRRALLSNLGNLR